MSSFSISCESKQKQAEQLKLKGTIKELFILGYRLGNIYEMKQSEIKTILRGKEND